MNDEELYLEATNEVNGEERNPALWAKVIALAEGDQEKAKYQYIKLRVDKLAKEKADEKPVLRKKTVNAFDDNYIPVAEFSRIMRIPEKKVVEMIRDGFYVGRIKENEWFVSRKEVGKEEQKTQIKLRNEATENTSGKEYIPAEEFAEYKGLTHDKVVKMVREGFYQGQIIDDKWYVAYSELARNENYTQSNSDSLFAKLISGDYGLPKTYWLFGVLGGLCFIIPAAVATAAKSMALLVLVLITSVIYSLIVAVGIWRASDKYKGTKVWAVLAKIAVIVGIISLLVDLASMGSMG